MPSFVVSSPLSSEKEGFANMNRRSRSHIMDTERRRTYVSTLTPEFIHGARVVLYYCRIGIRNALLCGGGKTLCEFLL